MRLVLAGFYFVTAKAPDRAAGPFAGVGRDMLTNLVAPGDLVEDAVDAFGGHLIFDQV